VATFVASEISTNVRELEGAITRLSALASLQNVEVTVPFAQAVLQPHLGNRAREITVEEVQRVVCDHFGISLNEMKSKRRTQHVAASRQIAMFLSRKLLSASFPMIGDKFGGRDHSTVIHAHTVVGKRIEADPTLRATIEGLERKLTKRGN
jgi:chromosomal replication initiator protein